MNRSLYIVHLYLFRGYGSGWRWRMMGEMERVNDDAENGPAYHFLYSHPLNGPSEICCPVSHLESHRSYIAIHHQNQAQISKDGRSILERTYLANRLVPPETK